MFSFLCFSFLVTGTGELAATCPYYDSHISILAHDMADKEMWSKAKTLGRTWLGVNYKVTTFIW